MKARIQWAGEAMFLGESGSGHVVVMDGPPEAGGRNLGVRPMEMVLLGLGGCSSFDVVSILKKSRQAVESCEAFLEAERASEDPKVFTKIHMNFVVKGRALKEAQVKRAVEEIYKVKVAGVNTFVYKGKIKRVRRQEGRTSDTKKAVVTLKQGQKLEAV